MIVGSTPDSRMPLDWKHEQFCLDAPDRTMCYCWPPARSQDQHSAEGK